MGVITLSRQFGAGGEEFGKTISSRIGYRMIARKEIEEKLLEIAGEGIPEKILVEKAPGILDRFTGDYRIWKNLLRESILYFAKDGDVLIIGRGSFHILKGVPGVLHLLVTGEKDKRIKNISKKEKTHEVDSEVKVDKIDGERTGFLKYYFGVDWPDPSSFHFTVNPLLLGMEKSAIAVEALIGDLDFASEYSREGIREIQRRYALTAGNNRLILSFSITPDLFQISIKEENVIEVRFFDVPSEIRKKSVDAITELLSDYTVHQIE